MCCGGRPDCDGNRALGIGRDDAGTLFLGMDADLARFGPGGNWELRHPHIVDTAVGHKRHLQLVRLRFRSGQER